MTPFRDVLEGAEPLPGGFALSIPPEWHQGRTAFGGFSASLALAAARQAGGEGLAPLRSAQISFAGPLYGPVEVRARGLRSGKSATWASAEIARDGEVGLTANFVFVSPRQSTADFAERPVPAGLVPVEQAAPMTLRPQQPVFLQSFYEVRYALPRSEEKPRGGEKQPEMCWWVRLNGHPGLDAATELLLVADCLPPAVMPMIPLTAPASTMMWQATLLDPAPATRDGWWLVRARADYAGGGFSSQQMGIWDADGRPVLSGFQSVAVFG